MGFIVLAFIAPHVGTPLACDPILESALECSLFLLFESVLFFLPGILFTTLFLLFCLCPTNCSCTPPLEFGVYKPSSPDKVFVIDQQSKEVKEVEEFALEEDHQADSEVRGEVPNEEEEEEEV